MKRWSVYIIVGGVIFFMIRYFTMDQESIREQEINVRNVTPIEVNTKNQLDLLDNFNKKEQVNTENKFSLGMSFQPESTLLTLKENYFIPYYILNKNINLIKGTYIIDSGKEDHITLLALQGTNRANVRLTNDNSWHSALKIPVKAQHSTEVSVEIQWDAKGENDLFLFPISQERLNYNNESFLGITRSPIFREEPELKEDAFKLHAFNLPENGKFNRFPNARLLDSNKQPIQTILDMHKVYLEKPFKYMNLDPVPYDDNIAILYVDEDGNVKLLEKKLVLLANQETMIDISDLSITQKESKRRYIIFLNNFNQESLIDYMSVDKKINPFFNTFQLALELFPVKN